MLSFAFLVTGIDVSTAACIVVVIVSNVTLALVLLLFPVGRGGVAAVVALELFITTIVEHCGKL